jgi:threonine dehydrogenase-like Zn-dependent dehydrogenase
MIACVIHGAKDLQAENRPAPQPSAGEVIVRFGAGGICGSDLHCYHEGRVGNFDLREPMVLGHGFAELFIASEDQCMPIPDSLSYPAAACAEPLAVTLHAVARAGS